MAIGIPVISTDRCNAALELVENGINGYVVSVGDDHELGIRINEVLNDSDLNSKMSYANLEKIRHFTIEEIVDSHINTINSRLKIG